MHNILTRGEVKSLPQNKGTNIFNTLHISGIVYLIRFILVHTVSNSLLNCYTSPIW